MRTSRDYFPDRPSPGVRFILVDADSDTILGEATPEQVAEKERTPGPIRVEGYRVYVQEAPAAD